MWHPIAIRRLRAVLFIALAAALLTIGGLSRAPAQSAPSAMKMSEGEMRGMLDHYFAAHPAHGAATLAAPVDSFLAVGFVFDEDHNTSTVVDTAHISRGQSILFKWVNGFHTVTSGDGSSDPNSGVMFNRQLTSAAGNFAFQYDTVGTFPFYCVVHESFPMKGVVVVTTPVSAPPVAGGLRAGFVVPPWPNPSRTGAISRFALARAGHARLEVFDPQGRRVATVLDRELPVGTFTIAWDGRRGDGADAPAGIYVIRLSTPGLSQSRSVAIER